MQGIFYHCVDNNRSEQVNTGDYRGLCWGLWYIQSGSTEHGWWSAEVVSSQRWKLLLQYCVSTITVKPD